MNYIKRIPGGFAHYKNGRQYGATTDPLGPDWLGLDKTQRRQLRKFGVCHE